MEEQKNKGGHVKRIEQVYKRARPPRVRAAATYIPQGIITNILLGLPVKSLSRFSCTCKTWYALIKDPLFIRMHIRKSIHDNKFSFMVPKKDIFSFQYHGSSDFTVPSNLDYPFRSDGTAAAVLGSCNGLFLVGVYDCQMGAWNQRAKPVTNNVIFLALCLWNPATKEYKELPVTLVNIPRYRYFCCRIAYGLGYDSATDDYKVIRILYYHKKHINEKYPGYQRDYYESEAHLYSLKTNSCKRVQDPPWLIQEPMQLEDIVGGTFVNSAIHWVCTNPQTIACFDVSSEEFKNIAMPEFDTDLLYNFSIAVLQGCLCVSLLFEDDNVNVFMMKEYGLRESWHKVFTLKRITIENRVQRWFHAVHITYERCLLYQNRFDNICLYYPESGCTKPLTIPGLPDNEVLQVEPYTESIVSLRSGTCVGKP